MKKIIFSALLLLISLMSVAQTRVLYFPLGVPPGDQMATALVNTGCIVTTVTTDVDFQTDIATPANYDLAIYFVQGGLPDATSVADLANFVNLGKKGMFCDWYRDAASANVFGANFTGTTNEGTVTVTDPLLSAGLPSNPFTISSSHWGVWSTGLSLLPGSTSAATFSPSGQTAIVRSMGGNMLFFGFLNDTNPFSNMYENAITSLVVPAPTIATTTFSGTYCAGATVNISYTITGTFTGGNVFTAELSDASGSFASPTAIGTLTSTAAGTINATIPLAATTGTGYRIRVKASTPATTGTDNGTNLIISAPTVSATTTSIMCNGGTATVTVTGANGTTPYTGEGAFTASAGAYTYTITDNAGCPATVTGTLTEPTLLTASSSATTIMCNGGMSTITVSGSGGTAPYTGATSYSAPAGPFTYTVTDNNGCTAIAAGTVTEPTLLTASASATAIFCNGGTATITVSGAGGTAPYTGEGINTVTAGSYTYTVTDNNGCTATTTGNITEPTLFTASSSSTSILCNGGTAIVNVAGAGGTTPYTGEGSYTSPAGTYSYTITDANGCAANTSGMITEPVLFTASSSTTAISCTGGSATVNVTGAGGTAPYTGEGSYTAAAGPYTYMITDANGCTATANGTLTEPTLFTAGITATPILCNGGTTAITLSGSGGTAPYTGEGTFTTTAGPYTYTITDNNGCPATATGNITEPALLTLNFATAAPILCHGGTGTITVTGSGGTTPYTGEGTFPVSGGSYLYTITDDNGCSSSAIDTVTDPAILATAQTIALCQGTSVTVGTSTYYTAGIYTDILTSAASCDSTVTTSISVINVDPSVSISGSTITAVSTTATYQWLDCNSSFAPISGQTSQSYTATVSGNYSVQINESGCIDTSSCISMITTGITDEAQYNVNIYPNPANDVFTIAIQNANVASLSISVVDIQGKVIFSTTESNVSGNYTKQINTDGISKGMYYVNLKSSDGLKVYKLIIQ